MVFCCRDGPGQEATGYRQAVPCLRYHQTAGLSQDSPTHRSVAIRLEIIFRPHTVLCRITRRISEKGGYKKRPDIRKGRISSQMRSRPFIFAGHRQLDILLQEICLYALVQVGICKNILFQVINKTGFRFSEYPYTVPVPIWRN